jgi:mRNA interferase RelE/StbE
MEKRLAEGLDDLKRGRTYGPFSSPSALMDAHYTKRFLASHADASPLIQRAIDRRVALLLNNLRHPSLRAEKYNETRDIWQAWVTASWRLYCFGH